MDATTRGKGLGSGNGRAYGPGEPAAVRSVAARHDVLRALLAEPALSLDATGVVTSVNVAATALIGAPPEEIVGRTLAQLVGSGDADRTARYVEIALAGEPQSWNVDLRARGGEPRSVEVSAAQVRVDGVVVGAEVVARDVTRHRLIEAQLTHQAQHDPLTGLANRALFRERVERALAIRPGEALVAAAGEGEQEREGGHHVAVLFIDLDDFKTVNDSLGHSEGDRLLTEVGARLLKATRGFDLVARLGGDEFAVLLDGMRREDDAKAVVDRITMILKRPIILAGREVIAAASIGVAHGRDARNADELLRNADVAMYQAKSAGKGRHAEFDHAMHAAAVARLEMAADLRVAIERNEMRLVYQPVVELTSAKVVSVEALLRWDRGRRGNTPPLEFIPVAEETGLIVPIGRWVLHEACMQLARWRASLSDVAELSMNVNVSGRQLDDPALLDDVRDALAAAGIPASCLTLEITESVIMQRVDTVVATLHTLRDLGVSLAIDDFGTGYSSLGYLKDFPVDVLKIDRAFVDSVARGGSDAALARTIIALGDALGLTAVAEGIEQVAQQAALADLGCHLGQGYLFARPLEAKDFASRFPMRRVEVGA